jgi:hypothetical protein
MLQPCRAGLGRNFPLINNLSSGNKKYMILPPTKGYAAPNPPGAFYRSAVTGWPRRASSYAIERKVVRPAITRHSAEIALECVRVDQNYRSLF